MLHQRQGIRPLGIVAPEALRHEVAEGGRELLHIQPRLGLGAEALVEVQEVLGLVGVPPSSWSLAV